MNPLALAFFTLAVVSGIHASAIGLSGWKTEGSWSGAPWALSPVGPSGVVDGTGASGPSGVVNGAVAVGPSGIVTGKGAVGPNGVNGLWGADARWAGAPVAVPTPVLKAANPWALSPVGPSGVVDATGASGPSGVVNGAGAVGPSGIVTGKGAVGPNGVTGLWGAEARWDGASVAVPTPVLKAANPWALSPVGPSGVVDGTGASGPSGVVNGAGAVGPSGIVTGKGAIGPNGPNGVWGAQASLIDAPVAVPSAPWKVANPWALSAAGSSELVASRVAIAAPSDLISSAVVSSAWVPSIEHKVLGSGLKKW